MAWRHAWIATCFGCSAAASGHVAEPARSLRDADFELPAWDSGDRRRRCVLEAPWGPSSWGVEASTFSDPSDYRLALARFALAGGVAHLHGEESDGRWGFVRYVQGDVWGGSHCGPIPWNRSLGVSLTSAATIELEVFREASALTSRGSSWLMFAVNLWFSSPSFPAGRDARRKKPLVMDLLFHHRCNAPGCAPRHYADEVAHHYQAAVGDAPERRWVTLEIPAGSHLEAALAHFDLPAEGVTLEQIDVLIELRHARGAMRIDAFRLRP